MTRSMVVDAEVRGRVVSAVVTGVADLAPATRMRVRTVLERHDSLHVDPDGWYALADHVAALSTIQDVTGGGVLRRIGGTVPGVLAGSCASTTPDEVLAGLDDRYQRHHRGADAGGFEYEHAGETTARVTSTSPYPDPVDHGLLEGACEQFAPTAYATVDPGEGYGRPDAPATYEVRW